MRSLISATMLAIVLIGAPALAQSIDLTATAIGNGVVVRGEKGMDNLVVEIARDAVPALEAIYSDFPQAPRPQSIEIRVVHDARNLRRVAPPGHGAPEWAAGIAYPDLGIISLATRRDANPIDTRSVLVHELAHLAMGAAVGDAAPRWLHEGFAYLHSSDWSLERFQTLAGMAWTGNVFAFSEIDAHFPDQEWETNRAYAQSYDFVAFLARRGRFADTDDDGDRWPFRHFLALLSQGVGMDEAARQAYSSSFKTLSEEWFALLRDRYMTAPVGLFGLMLWFIGAVLLMLAYWRKKTQGRAKVAAWEREESLDEVPI